MFTLLVQEPNWGGTSGGKVIKLPKYRKLFRSDVELSSRLVRTSIQNPSVPYCGVGVGVCMHPSAHRKSWTFNIDGRGHLIQPTIKH